MSVQKWRGYFEWFTRWVCCVAHFQRIDNTGMLDMKIAEFATGWPDLVDFDGLS